MVDFSLCSNASCKWRKVCVRGFLPSGNPIQTYSCFYPDGETGICEYFKPSRHLENQDWRPWHAKPKPSKADKAVIAELFGRKDPMRGYIEAQHPPFEPVAGDPPESCSGASTAEACPPVSPGGVKEAGAVDKPQGAMHHDSGKVPLDTYPTTALFAICEVFEFGAKKYHKFNWRKGMPWTKLVASTLRHVTMWSIGQDRDPESGLSHLAHAGCNIAMLLDMMILGLGTDDRDKRWPWGEGK